jgi:hypothetical protein
VVAAPRETLGHHPPPWSPPALGEALDAERQGLGRCPPDGLPHGGPFRGLAFPFIFIIN